MYEVWPMSVCKNSKNDANKKEPSGKDSFSVIYSGLLIFSFSDGGNNLCNHLFYL